MKGRGWVTMRNDLALVLIVRDGLDGPRLDAREPNLETRSQCLVLYRDVIEHSIADMHPARCLSHERELPSFNPWSRNSTQDSSDAFD
jgi:hypothetical protein